MQIKTATFRQKPLALRPGAKPNAMSGQVDEKVLAHARFGLYTDRDLKMDPTLVRGCQSSPKNESGVFHHTLSPRVSSFFGSPAGGPAGGPSPTPSGRGPGGGGPGRRGRGIRSPGGRSGGWRRRRSCRRRPWRSPARVETPFRVPVLAEIWPRVAASSRRCRRDPSDVPRNGQGGPPDGPQGVASSWPSGTGRARWPRPGWPTTGPSRREARSAQGSTPRPREERPGQGDAPRPSFRGPSSRTRAS